MATGDNYTADSLAADVKLSISGAALAALLQRCAGATGDCDGLLFGRATRPPPPAPTLYDYDDAPAAAPAAPSLFISVSGHLSLASPSALSDPLGRYQPLSPSAPAPLGFFSSRRRTALRPSMRELSIARSLAKTLAHPLLFILISPSASPNLSIHSFDYRAFLLLGSGLVPASLSVVNVGPGFRDQYHSFAPESPLPAVLPTTQPPSREGGYSIAEEKVVEGMLDGFGMGKLQEVIGSATGQAAEVLGLYAAMLGRLEKLAREVEKSNRRVYDQENRNMIQRFKSAGL